MSVEIQPCEWPLGHSLLACQPVSPALGRSSLRHESPSLSSPPAMHPPCRLPAFNWVLTPLYFTVSIISLSLLSSLSIYLLKPISSHTAATNTFFFFFFLRRVFQRVSIFSILRCEIHFDTGLEIEWSWQYAPICPLSPPHTLPLSPSPWASAMFPLWLSMKLRGHLTVFHHPSRKIRVSLS